MGIGERIRELRGERGWSQREVARRAGLAPNSVALVERGERTPSATTVEKIAHALGVDPGELFKPPKATARPAPGDLLKRLLRDHLGHTFVLTDPERLREEARGLSMLEVLGQLVALSDEVAFLKPVFLDPPHYILGRAKGEAAYVSKEEHELISGLGREIQAAWTGSRTRAHILAEVVEEKARVALRLSGRELESFREELEALQAGLTATLETAV